MSILIGLSGLKGSGKNTVADVIAAWAAPRGASARSKGFADPLKYSFARLFLPDCSEGEAIQWCNELKDEGSGSSLSVLWRRTSEDGTQTSIEHRITGRKALQRYGTEAHRDIFDDDFWVNVLLPTDTAEGEDDAYRIPVWPRRFNGPFDNPFVTPDFCTVTDVRFPNEAERIIQLGGVVWEIVRPTDNGGLGEGTDAHASEAPLPREMVNVTIVNDSTIEALDDQVGTSLSISYGETFPLPADDPEHYTNDPEAAPDPSELQGITGGDAS